MATGQQTDDVFAEIQTAYADAGPQADRDGYVNGMRCLSFLTSAWLTPKEAYEAVTFIEAYNAFDAETVAEYLSEIEEADPDALVAIGREGSPVLYVETDAPADVEAILNTEKVHDADSPFGRGQPDELGRVDPGSVGAARKDLYGDGEDQMDPHTSCTHDAPPVAAEDYADPDPHRAHVRAWWD